MNQGFVSWSSPLGKEHYINIQDQKPSGTAGGGFTSGAWQTRTLNTIASDTGGIVVLANNQLTLPPGTYRVWISCPAFRVNSHQARLWNVTTGLTQLVGTSDQTLNTGSDSTRSVIAGRFTIETACVFEIQHRATTTQATQGFGFFCNFGEVEVYTIAEFFKEG